MSLSIDGTICQGEPGDTVLEVARRYGIDIPALCYAPEARPRGACRLCLVEVAGRDDPVPACMTPAQDGMTVLTETARLRRARRLVLELLLSDHPQDCRLCEASGVCELQALAYRYGVRGERFTGARHPVFLRADNNPFIARDYSKCTLCGLCARVCEEVAGVGAVRIQGRGFEAHVGTPGDTPLAASDCRFCGRCVSVCPTGALTERKRHGLGRLFEAQRVRSVCPHCGVGCELEIVVRQGQIVGIVPAHVRRPRAAVPAASAADGPASRGEMVQGDLCVKGRFAYDFVQGGGRLLTPLVRRGPKMLERSLGEASWEEAVELAATGLLAVRERWGPQAVGFVCSCRSTNESDYVLQKLARAVVGTNNVDNGAGLCEPPQVFGADLALGTGLMSNSQEELERASLVFLVGCDPEQTHPVIGSRLKRAARRGTRLIVADPRKTDLVPYADTYLRLKVGTEVTLINALIRVLLDEGLYDREFVAEHTEGLEELAEAVRDKTLRQAETLTDIPQAQIQQAARDLAGAESVMFLHTSGAAHPMCGMEIALALRNLALLTGHVGRPCAGPNALRIQNNVQGACDMGGLPDVLPGYQRLTDPQAVAKCEAAWGATLSREPGLRRGDFMDAALQGRLKALYIVGENPVISDANPERTRLALESLELLVVQDIFRTETAELADVVFPAAAWAEVDGTFTNTERRVQRVRAAVPAPGTARPDWEIISHVSERAGYPMAYGSAREIWQEVASLCPLFAGITYERLEAGGLQWPCTGPSDPGCRYLYQRLHTPGVREAFRPVQPSGRVAGADTDQEYPLILTTGKRLYHYQPGTTAQHARGLTEVWPEDVLEVSPRDAERFNVTEGRRVRVVTRGGEMLTTVRVTDRTPDGVLFLSLHSPEALGREFTLCAIDPLSGSAEYGACGARIESLEAAYIGQSG